MCCVNRSHSGEFPPAFGKPSGYLHRREEEKVRKNKKVVPLITTAARWQTCDLVGCCSGAVAHVKLMCVPTLKPASSDLGQTSRFSRLRSLDRKPFGWIRSVTHHHQLLPAPLASVFSALLPFVTLFPALRTFWCHVDQSLLASPASLFPRVFRSLFVPPACSLFELQKVGIRGRGRMREDEGRRFWARHLCDYLSISTIGQDRPPCSLRVL